MSEREEGQRRERRLSVVFGIMQTYLQTGSRLYAHVAHAVDETQALDSDDGTSGLRTRERNALKETVV